MWNVAAYFFSDFTIGKVIALVAILTSLTAALVLSLDTLATSISATLPSDVTTFAAAVLPTNFTACISVIVVARVTRWVYDWHVTIAKQLAS